MSERPSLDGEGYDPPDRSKLFEIEDDEFKAAFGETLEDVIDVNRLKLGEDISDLPRRLQEITEGLREGEDIRERIRTALFPILIREKPVPEAGWYKVREEKLDRIYRGLLFNGGVEACYGTSLIHDTLSITMAQLGVSLVSYKGNQGTWVQRLYRRDMRIKGLDPIEEVMALLQKRRQRDNEEAESVRDKLSELAQRGILSYLERSLLLEKSQAVWRIGWGIPIPYEMLTGGGLVVGGDMPLLTHSLALWQALLEEHKRWVFVTDKLSDRVARTFAEALDPLEYAVVGSPEQTMRNIVRGHLPRGRRGGRDLQKEAEDFVDRVGPKIVIGVYRASYEAEPSVFYAHSEFVHQAAHIIMADSILQQYRGFPVLLDLAKYVCNATFGADLFHATIQQAYSDAKMPFRYHS